MDWEGRKQQPIRLALMWEFEFDMIGGWFHGKTSRAVLFCCSCIFFSFFFVITPLFLLCFFCRPLVFSPFSFSSIITNSVFAVVFMSYILSFINIILSIPCCCCYYYYYY